MFCTGLLVDTRHQVGTLLQLVDTTARSAAAIAAVAGAEVLVHENLREEVTARG